MKRAVRTSKAWCTPCTTGSDPEHRTFSPTCPMCIHKRDVLHTRTGEEPAPQTGMVRLFSRNKPKQTEEQKRWNRKRLIANWAARRKFMLESVPPRFDGSW